MLRVDCYYFYALAVKIHPLTDLRVSSPLAEEWVVLHEARQELFQFFSLFPLRTTRTPANTLVQAINRVVPLELSEMRFNLDNGEKVIVPYFEGHAIREAAVEFESVLKAELVGWDAFFVSQKGAFSTTELMQQAETMVPEPGRSYLTKKATADFRQAGMCLAFNLGTAACFHVARATEEIIREYYRAVVGALPDIKQRNWGAYHRNLSRCSTAESKVLGWLKHITEEYRNPVLHPDEILSVDDATEFINACIALISSMGKALIKLGYKSEAEREAELLSNNEDGQIALQPLLAESGEMGEGTLGF
ncbi:hypothetical protein [Edaphobacter modestus]|uniref:Uncharacterized protein n=1 Tax=Edaphobacter modestus TaxID=388466 RepID=A0A4Q7YVF3_9BACT|nr:hypothetical protein [Edaphobacter modestus]RZU41121.1 hypothetical protein BDD14_2619 [Edaphobacter modestus]